jgi:hypothetical protein
MHFGLWITNTADHPSPLGAVWEQPERRFSPTIEETAPRIICVTTTGKHVTERLRHASMAEGGLGQAR